MDEKRVASLETITKRLMRRANKHTIGLITPYPISNAIFGEDVKGVVLRYMFPCDGIISRGMVKLGTKPKNSPNLLVRLFNDTESNEKGFLIEKKFLIIEPNVPIKAGDCLEVSITSASEIDPIKEVWVALLWKPTVNNLEAKSFLISEIENDIQSGTLTEQGALP
jgi:hypothetical protein